MVDYIHLTAYIGVISTLLYLGPLCFFDIKFRSIPRWSLLPLIMVNIPALIILYTNGLPPPYIAFSTLMTVFFIFLFHIGAYRGADARFLILISWFCPLNPLNTNDNLFQLQYVIYLAGVSVLWMIHVYFYNRKHSKDVLNPDLAIRKTLWQKFNDYPNGSPWMIPISIAFVLTVIFG